MRPFADTQGDKKSAGDKKEKPQGDRKEEPFASLRSTEKGCGPQG